MPASIPGEVILNMAVVEPNEYNDLQSHLAGGGSLNDFKMQIDGTGSVSGSELGVLHRG